MVGRLEEEHGRTLEEHAGEDSTRRADRPKRVEPPDPDAVFKAEECAFARLGVGGLHRVGELLVEKATRRSTLAPRTAAPSVVDISCSALRMRAMIE